MCTTITIISDDIDEEEEFVHVLLTTQSDVTLTPHASATVHIIEYGTIVPDNISTEGTCAIIHMRGGVSPPHSSLSVVSLLILGFIAFTALNRQ